MELKTRPIDTWPGKLTANRKPSPFDSTYSKTLQVLEREVEHLTGSRNTLVVVQLAIREQDLRLDGGLRANARTEAHPGVIVSFESKRTGPLQFACDRFDRPAWKSEAERRGWHQNLRAIALGLEALRKVDRYGMGTGTEQYRGFAALGAGTPMVGRAPEMGPEQAARIIAEAAGDIGWWDTIVEGTDLDALYRDAMRATHPDAGGSEQAARAVNEAKAVLDKHLARV